MSWNDSSEMTMLSSNSILQYYCFIDFTIATDELGNRNNTLSVPIRESSAKKSSTDHSETKSEDPTTSIPELIVEKVDAEPRYGDDFGPDATVGERDAHEMRAQDAEPDYVVIRSETSTPAFAATAAEVAESAAIIDREPSPAPLSDEEAGRTGQRRMSMTPIPEVALTAAEVADSAALIDQIDDVSFHIRTDLFCTCFSFFR
jgi:hypothetical protein